jgi:hypothetical protein
VVCIYFYYLCISTKLFYFLAVSVTADAGDVASLKSAFDTLRKKLGNEPEVLLYNVSGFRHGGWMFA